MVKVKTTAPVSTSVRVVHSKGGGPKKGPSTTSVKKAAPKRNEGTKPKKPNGTNALAEIRKYQRSTELLIKKAPFNRLVRYIARGFMPDVRFEGAAVISLMEAAESFLVKKFQKFNLYAIHRKCVTITVKDMKLDRDVDAIDGKEMSHVQPIYDDLGTKIQYD